LFFQRPFLLVFVITQKLTHLGLASIQVSDTFVLPLRLPLPMNPAQRTSARFSFNPALLPKYHAARVFLAVSHFFFLTVGRISLLAGGDPFPSPISSPLIFSNYDKESIFRG
jgi:hypothetical protein